MFDQMFDHLIGTSAGFRAMLATGRHPPSRPRISTTEYHANNNEKARVSNDNNKAVSLPENARFARKNASLQQ